MEVSERQKWSRGGRKRKQRTRQYHKEKKIRNIGILTLLDKVKEKLLVWRENDKKRMHKHP